MENIKTEIEKMIYSSSVESFEDHELINVPELTSKFIEYLQNYTNPKEEINMNLKWKKKPIIIEAFQMTPERRQDNSEWPNWMHLAWNKERDEVGALYPTIPHTEDGTLSIKTLEGEHLVSWGDYIIQGINLELYPCKEEIFLKTYEKVEE